MFILIGRAYGVLIKLVCICSVLVSFLDPGTGPQRLRTLSFDPGDCCYQIFKSL